MLGQVVKVWVSGSESGSVRLDLRFWELVVWELTTEEELVWKFTLPISFTPGTPNSPSFPNAPSTPNAPKYSKHSEHSKSAEECVAHLLVVEWPKHSGCSKHSEYSHR